MELSLVIPCLLYKSFLFGKIFNL